MNYEAIWLDDKSNVDLGFIVRGTSQRPGLPGTVDRTLTIPGRHGQYDFGAELSSRSIVLDCAFITRDAAELQQKVMELSRYLVDSFGRPRTMKLRLRERPGQHFNVRYVGSFDIDRIIGTGLFSLPITAFDPFAYADQEQIFEDEITASPYIKHVTAVGNVRSSPVIVLTNEGTTTITHIKITNEYRLE
jgi:phage-related protein